MITSNDKIIVLIGSYARGDYNDRSDCDLVLINCNDIPTDIYILEKITAPVNIIKYDTNQFNSLYAKGSLFFYHILYEGLLISGDRKQWAILKESFNVQQKFDKELRAINKRTVLLSNLPIFNDMFLTPLFNVYSELKNACIFFLAENKIYEFNKSRCFSSALDILGVQYPHEQLRIFYDYSVRNIDICLPFNPNKREPAGCLLKAAREITRMMYDYCR